MSFWRLMKRPAASGWFWVTEKDGREVRYYADPDVGLGRRFSAWFMGLLPVEEHL